MKMKIKYVVFQMKGNECIAHSLQGSAVSKQPFDTMEQAEAAIAKYISEYKEWMGLDLFVRKIFSAESK